VDKATIDRIEHWSELFRTELYLKVRKLENPTETEIDRVARWLCDVHTWHPETSSPDGNQ
jgi:hypothetical protein